MPTSLILFNGNILTMAPEHPRADALAIGPNGRIQACGKLKDVEPLAGRATERIDMKGRTVVPGFNDCHMHIIPYGLDLIQADLSPEACVNDIPTLIDALRAWAQQNSNTEWILGSRYNQNNFPGADHPTRHDLDAAFPDRPVYISQTSKHAGVANSVAMNLAGLTRDTENPKGGTIVRDERGEPTGVLLETAEDLVKTRLPRPTDTELCAAVIRANEALVRNGITSASDLNTGWLDLKQEIDAYRAASRFGPNIRTTLFPELTKLGPPQTIPTRVEIAGSHGFPESIEDRSDGPVRLGAVKLFSDGALTVRTAALHSREYGGEPYADGSGHGVLMHPYEELSAYVVAAHVGGWQVAVHAIGDRAIEACVNSFANAHRALTRPYVRHRIEHAMILNDYLVSRLKDQGIIPVMQPEFISRLGDAYVLALGENRASRLNPVATVQRAGIAVPFSSDCPVVPGAPLDGIRAAIRRTAPSGRTLGEDERISAEQAIRNYTYWAAYSVYDEQESGSIEPGKRADLAILSVDPTKDLYSTELVATMIGGRVVWGQETLESSGVSAGHNRVSTNRRQSR